eukprot:482284_1
MTNQLKQTNIQPAHAHQTADNIAELIVHGYIREINNLPTTQYTVPLDILQMSLQYFVNSNDCFSEPDTRDEYYLTDKQSFCTMKEGKIFGTIPIKYTNHHRYKWKIKLNEITGYNCSVGIGISQRRNKDGIHYIFYGDAKQTQQRLTVKSNLGSSFEEGDIIFIDVDFTAKTVKCYRNDGYMLAEFRNILVATQKEIYDKYMNENEFVMDPVEYYLAVVVSSEEDDEHEIVHHLLENSRNICRVSASIRSFLWFDDIKDASAKYNGYCKFFWMRRDMVSYRWMNIHLMYLCMRVMLFQQVYMEVHMLSLKLVLMILGDYVR